MRNGELECVHGVGHSANTHGCDGCCYALGVYERERIIAKLDKYTMYRFEKQWVIDLIEEDDD